VLLAAQLLGFVLYPLMESSRTGRTLFGLFGLFVLGAALRVVHKSPWLTWLGGLLAVLIVILCVASMIAPHPALDPWTAALQAAFYFYAAGSLIAYMMADWHATTDELFAAGATFTLLAWGFAYLYVLIQALQPGCFAGAVHPQALRTWTELMYMSFALLSSTGIGDVIPLSAHARMVAAVEMFVGVMYLTAVVSRLIGLTLVRQRDPPLR